MIFRQLFEPESSTYTYLFGCRDTNQAVPIDPVVETIGRDLAIIQGVGLRLACTLETHIHADHITSVCRLRRITDCKVAHPEMDGLPCADIGVSEGHPLTVGSLVFKPLFTLGHTATHHSYLFEIRSGLRVLTGDSLLIDGCGRTDFQSGDAAALYRSIHEKILTLPNDTLVYLAHGYSHRFVSTIAQERERNARLEGGKTLDEFVSIMQRLTLPYPKKMDVALPANRQCGKCPEDLPDDALRDTGGRSLQG